MFCKNCGTAIPDGTIFCPNCGTNQAAQAPVQPQQPVYGYAPAPQADAQPAKGLAVASLVLGIVSLIMFAVIAGPLAIILGGAAKSKGNRSGMATGGIVCGIIGVAGWLLIQIFLQGTIFSMF